MDRMTETEARELLEYIYNKPSYLFLGQAYHCLLYTSPSPRD